ncbi:hypothetical protein BJ982_001396 [Sphaerisporangium siamense]|uniref:Uncharacterized protein n=1 Tax=Sphaerisporangium siamense TaxID=795645 RepID=A0A7W7D459_9ACTN|nr:hypothetical protein [Sphaerisporangium siamense]
MLIRREPPTDIPGIRDVLTTTFATEAPPVEVGLVDAAR